MEQSKKLEDLNRQALEKLDAFLKSKADAAPEHHEKIDAAKAKWQAAWNEILEALLVLERLEI